MSISISPVESLRQLGEEIKKAFSEQNLQDEFDVQFIELEEKGTAFAIVNVLN